MTTMPQMETTADRPPRRRLVRTLATVLFAAALAGWSSALWLDSYPYVTPPDMVWAVSFLVFPVVGLLLAVKLPANPIGWLFIVGPGGIGAGVTLMEAGNEPFGDNVFGVGLLLLLASLLLFPDGRYPGRVWMWAHAAIGVAILFERFVTGSDSGIPVVSALLLTVASLVYRAVRGPAETRRQIALPVAAAVIGVLGAALSGLLSDSDWAGVIWSVVMTAGVPAAIAVSILRYRLYEFDRLVSRTVAYTLVAAVVGLVYVLPVLLLPRLFGGSSDLVVAGSTLAAAAVFTPVRRRVQRAVDRRFDRARYDAQREVEALSGRLRAGVTLDAVCADVGRLVRATLGPNSAAIWIREPAS